MNKIEIYADGTRVRISERYGEYGGEVGNIVGHTLMVFAGGDLEYTVSLDDGRCVSVPACVVYPVEEQEVRRG